MSVLVLAAFPQPDAIAGFADFGRGIKQKFQAEAATRGQAATRH
jgi:hypothetical protein